MTQRQDDDRLELPSMDVQGFSGSDMLAVLAVATLLVAIGLAAFMLTIAFAR